MTYQEGLEAQKNGTLIKGAEIPNVDVDPMAELTTTVENETDRLRKEAKALRKNNQE